MTQQGQGFPEADDQFEDNTITRVERSGSSFDITAAGWSLWCGDNCPIAPQVGMMARTYGRGLGSRVRGLFINGQKFWYRTEAEDKEHASIELYGADAADWLSRWDAGKSVWSIEMGGIGPGYEQAIQITAAEQLRWLLKTAPAHSDLMDRAKWPAIRDAMDTVLLDDDGPVKRLGLSGAQWGAAIGLSTKLYIDGPRNIMADDAVKDRHIQVSKNFPG